MKKTTTVLAENSFILLISTALVKIISAIFKIPLASDKFLGEVGFGYFSVAHDLYAPFYILAISGLPLAVSYIVSEKTAQNSFEKAEQIFYSYRKLFIKLGLLISFILVLIILPLFLFSNANKSSYFSVFAIIPSILLCFIISAYRGYFEGFSNMYPTAISKLIESIIKLFLGLLLSYISLKLTNNIALASVSAIMAITIGTAIATLYLHLKFKKRKNIKNADISVEKSDFKNLLLLSLPFVFAAFSASLVALLDIFTVKIPLDYANSEYINRVISQNGKIIGDVSAYLYGVRSKAYTVYNLIPTFTASLGVGVLPILTSISAKNDNKALKSNIDYTLKLISTITLPAAIGLTLLSGRIMSLLYSTATPLGDNLLKIYGITALFSGISIPLITVLQALAKQRSIMVNIGVSLLIKIVINILLVTTPEINIYSCAIGTLACYIYLFIAVFILLKNTLKGIDIVNSFLKPLFCAVICGISAFLITLISSKNIVTVFAVLAAILLYFALILITKTFSRGEISQFPVLNKFFKE